MLNKQQRWLLAAATLGMLLLVGCGQQPSKSSSASHSSTASVKSKAQASHSSAATSTSSSKQAATSSSAAAKTTPWTSAKASALQQFMTSWGQSMGQQYRSYDATHPVDFYGMKVPSEFDHMPPAIGQTKISYTLSADGTTTADYAVVAIYSDAATAGFGDAHLYLFTLHHGTPEVLVTMQNQGNENNWLYFTVTENADLKAGFAKLVDAN